MHNFDSLRQILTGSPQYIVITSHRNPDGDAIGSCLAMQLYLTRLGHRCVSMVPSEFPEFVEFLPGCRDILIYDLDPEQCLQYIEAADIIFALDYNALSRVDKMGDAIAATSAVKVLLDHHLEPENFAEYIWSESWRSSTCEIVDAFIEKMQTPDLMDPLIAECLYTGILTDTGGFRYSTTPELFERVAAIQRKGVDNGIMQDKVFNSATEKQVRLLGHCLANRMEVLGELNTAIIWLSKADYENFDIQRGDTEGIVNQMLKIKSVQMAVFITEQPKIVKLSFRSKGSFSVQAIASAHFSGGGHINASGGHSFQSLDETLTRLKGILPHYKDQLNLHASI